MPKRVRLLLLFLFMTAALATAAYYTAASLPNRKVIPPEQMLSDLSQIFIVLEDERLQLDNSPEFYGQELYFPVDFIKNYADKYIYWDSATLTVTTERELIRIKPDELVYYINHEEHKLDLPVRIIQNTAYLPLGLIEELYGLDISYAGGAIKTAIVDMPDKPAAIAAVSSKKETAMRYEPDKRSPIQLKLAPGEKVCVFGINSGYTKVRTETGLLGYVASDDLTVTEKNTPQPPSSPVPSNDEKRLNIVWDVVTSQASNRQENKRIIHKGLDVLSPTWFSFDAEKLNGDIISLADPAYVEWAHQNGYQVWALISDNFKSEVSHAVLSSTETREHVIRQLVDLVDEYGLDGINIDFEAVKKADAGYFLQFLRELAPLLKKRSAILSADLYVPTYTKYYNRTEIALTVDYIIIMGYDETEFYSDISGPAASAPFVERGITDTLLEAPPEKVILGIPYYSRIWMEETVDGELFVRARDVGMDYAYRIFAERDTEFVWLDDLKCHYGEFTADEDGSLITYKVWLEDLKSIEEKLLLSEKYGLAGVAGWRRDLEAEGVWDLIFYYLKGED